MAFHGISFRFCGCDFDIYIYMYMYIFVYIYICVIYKYTYGCIYFVPLVVKAYWAESERFSCPGSLNPEFRPRVLSKQVGDVFKCIWGVCCIEFDVDLGKTIV